MALFEGFKGVDYKPKSKKKSLFSFDGNMADESVKGGWDGQERVSTPTLKDTKNLTSIGSQSSNQADKLPDWMSNYGVERPKATAKRANLFDKILVSGLTGIDAMRNDQGLIPGLLAGYAGIRAGEREAATDADVVAQKNFENERNFRQKSDLGIRNADALDAYRKGSLGIAQQNANTAANKEPHKTDLQLASEAQARIDEAFAAGTDPNINDYNLVKKYNAIKQIK